MPGRPVHLALRARVRRAGFGSGAHGRSLGGPHVAGTAERVTRPGAADDRPPTHRRSLVPLAASAGERLRLRSDGSAGA
jgi:hypothetical protein